MKGKQLKTTNIESLFKKVVTHVDSARAAIMRSVDTEQVKAYWRIGRDIVEEEQAGLERAGYGKELLTQLSLKLIQQFGKGFGRSTLADMRQFYLANKVHALRGQLSEPEFKLNLSWTHYRSLMRVSNQQARSFYEIESSVSGALNQLTNGAGLLFNKSHLNQILPY